MMPLVHPFPVSERFSNTSPEEYIDFLLEFASDPLLRTLCGGVHILDFFTRDSETEPKDIYRTVVPADWISFFELRSIDAILELLLRTPLENFPTDVPATLRAFVKNVRDHSLQRSFVRRDKSEKTKKTTGYGTERALNAGMKPKKIHEVENFAAFLDDLVRDIQAGDAETGGMGVSHVVDYGSGQAYLSRTVAKKYGHNVVGIESRDVNINGAKHLDRTFDNLATRKLRYKLRMRDACNDGDCGGDMEEHIVGSLQYVQTFITDGNIDEVVNAIHDIPAVPVSAIKPPRNDYGPRVKNEDSANGIHPPPEKDSKRPKSLLLTSLHSCGNLVHHALAAFQNTPAVRAVALIGCCYNLMTEKHGETFKPPYLRSSHPRLVSTSTAGDPKGFPISAGFTEKNVQLNITARSMACQAPANWTEETCADFFQRHFYRALLQRIFFDRGMVDLDSADPIIIGSLKKGSFDSFVVYCRAAIKKLGWEGKVQVENEEAEEYMKQFWSRKKELSVIWSLMAFSASIVESLIVVDRWLFLKEIGCRQAWVEAAFDYVESPRNMVVVGVR